MAFHAAWDRADRPFPREHGDLEGDWSRTVQREGEAVPGELRGSKIARPRAGTGGVSGAVRSCGGCVEEKKGRDGEEDNEEEGGAKI